MKKLFSLFVIALFAMSAMAENYLPGTWNGEFSAGTDSRYLFVDNTLQLHLSVGTYEFKLFDSYGDSDYNKWFGNNGTMSMGNCTGWTFEKGKNNCGFYAPIEGDYTFTISWNDGIPTISATYPTPAGQRLEQGENVVYINGTYSDDQYTLTIVASKPMQGLGGSFWAPSTGNADVRTNQETINAFSRKYSATSTRAFQLYTPLYVLMPGQVTFDNVTINWTEDLGTGEDCDLALTSNASLNFDLADAENLTSQIAYTTSSTGAVTYKSGNNAVATVSETGLITAVGVGTTTITVTQASDATYKKGKAVINVTVENSNFGPATAPTAPTREAEKVLAIYTDRYGLAINSTYKTDNWGSTVMTEERLIGTTDHVRIYQMTGGVIVWGENNGTNNAIRGLDGKRYESYTGLNAAQMEYLHVDIWCDHERNFTSIVNDNSRGAQGLTTPNGWKSYDVPLTGINHDETGVENVRWLKFDGFVANDVVAIANVYFYTTQDLNQAAVLTTFSATPNSQLTKVGAGNNISLNVKDQLSRDINEATITYTISPEDAGSIENNIYTPSKAGWATITAHASYDEVNLDAASFRVLAHAGDNLVKSNSLPNSKVIAQVAEDPNGGAADAFFAIDGNDESQWVIAEPAGTENHEFDAWFVVDLGANYDLELATVHFEGASSKNYDIEVASSYDGNETVWTKIVDGATTQGMQNITKYHEELTAAKNVRYVRYFSHQAATGYGHKIYEFQVFGAEAADPKSYDLTTADTDWYSLYLDYAVTIPSGIAAYTGVVNNNGLNVTAIETGVIPANTAVLVKSTAAGTYTFDETTSAAFSGSNDLKGVLTATTVESILTANQNHQLLVLGSKEGAVGFYNKTSGSVAANRAYLLIPTNAAPALRIIEVENTATAIENTEASDLAVKFIENGQVLIMKNGVIYNVLGQVVR